MLLPSEFLGGPPLSGLATHPVASGNPRVRDLAATIAQGATLNRMKHSTLSFVPNRNVIKTGARATSLMSED